MLAYLSFLWNAWAAFKAIWKRAQELDDAGIAKFSEQWWRELRKWVEIRVVLLCKHEDKRIAKAFGTYAAFLHGVLIFMKSDALAAVYAAQGNDLLLDRAIGALENKDTTAKPPALGDPGVSGPHVP